MSTHARALSDPTDMSLRHLHKRGIRRVLFTLFMSAVALSFITVTEGIPLIISAGTLPLLMTGVIYLLYFYGDNALVQRSGNVGVIHAFFEEEFGDFLQRKKYHFRYSPIITTDVGQENLQDIVSKIYSNSVFPSVSSNGYVY